jgi:DNA-binding NarL/FixJ family response regulator
MIRVFLADDNRDILTDLREELADEFEIIGSAENGREALKAVVELEPDVLVLDMRMPFLNGLEVARHLQTEKNPTRIVFLTIHEEPEYISAAFAAGAQGYVTKRRLASDLKHSIREVFAGRTFLSPSLHA